MSAIHTKDGTRIYFKDWGSGRSVVFSHGWPLSSDAWEDQMMFLASRGYRCIAFDRRGHGRSSQPWNGYDMETFGDDIAAVMEALSVEKAVLVGHSMGGGDVARYIGRHGTKRVEKVVLIGSVTPLLAKTESNPSGVPIDVFDQIRTKILTDRAQFFKDFAVSFYGANREGSRVSQGLLDWFWFQAMMSGAKGVHDCVKAFSETDQTEDLRKFDVPTLILHGDDDQTVPIGITAERAAKIVPNATLKVYKGGSHGLIATSKEEVNADLLSFIKESKVKAAA